MKQKWLSVNGCKSKNMISTTGIFQLVPWQETSINVFEDNGENNDT
jgi:hypothetical protein